MTGVQTCALPIWFYYYIQKLTQQTTTGGPTVYLTGTSPVLSAGTWSIDFNAIGGNNNVNKIIEVGFYIDNVLQGHLLSNKSSSSSNDISMVITKDLTLTNATHTFEIRFEAVSGSAFIEYGAIRARLVN